MKPGDVVKLSNSWSLPIVFIWGIERVADGDMSRVAGRFSRDDVGLVICSSKSGYILILAPDGIGWVNDLSLVRA